MSLAATDQLTTRPENHHTRQAPMALHSEPMQWAAQGGYAHDSLIENAAAFCTPTLFSPNTGYLEHPQQAHNNLSYNTNYDLTYPHYNPGCSRVYDGTDYTGLPSEMTASYPPSTFFHSPPQVHSTPSVPDGSASMQVVDDYDMQYGSHIKREDQFDYSSPYSDLSRASTPYSTGHEEGNPIDKEQPYAQLIYRALLDAPDYTMVLRDIYDWFRTYTDKATHSETKGWQNSIRHNLSMNGVSSLFLVFVSFSAHDISSRCFPSADFDIHLANAHQGIRESRFSVRRHHKGLHVAPHPRGPP